MCMRSPERSISVSQIQFYDALLSVKVGAAEM